MADEPMTDRALGCLLGLAVGDAVGTTLEFTPRDARPPLTDMVGGGPFHVRPGEWTDDTRPRPQCQSSRLPLSHQLSISTCHRRTLQPRSPAGKISSEGELMGSAEALQQLLLILIPALILILIDNAKRP